MSENPFNVAAAPRGGRATAATHIDRKVFRQSLVQEPQYLDTEVIVSRKANERLHHVRSILDSSASHTAWAPFP